MNNEQLPKEVPRGFYYHYKHDSTKGFTDYAYEVVGIGRNTEEKTLMSYSTGRYMKILG
jgi:hypothetical protein